jgi:hypothetical protein
MLSFLDMNTPTADRVVRSFHVLLTVLLGLVVAAAVVLPGLVASGTGELTVQTSLDRPFRVELPSGRSIADEPAVVLRSVVDEDDTDTRVALAAGMFGILVVAAFALWNLRSVVQSARSADPFVAANVRRLRLFGWTCVAFFVAVRLVASAADATLDSPYDVSVSVPGPGFWPAAFIVAGVFTLAQVFRAGVELRELEQGTI